MYLAIRLLCRYPNTRGSNHEDDQHWVPRHASQRSVLTTHLGLSHTVVSHTIHLIRVSLLSDNAFRGQIDEDVRHFHLFIAGLLENHRHATPGPRVVRRRGRSDPLRKARRGGGGIRASGVGRRGKPHRHQQPGRASYIITSPHIPLPFLPLPGLSGREPEVTCLVNFGLLRPQSDALLWTKRDEIP